MWLAIRRIDRLRVHSYAFAMAEAEKSDWESPAATSGGKVHAERAAKANGLVPPSPEAASPLPEADLLLEDCPPAEAIDGPFHLFRMSETRKPAASDCLTAYETGAFKDFNPCRRRSLSSYIDRLDAERLRRRVRHFRQHNICEGVVPAGAGVHLATPSLYEKSHWSWWPAAGVVRHTFFSVRL